VRTAYWKPIGNLRIKPRTRLKYLEPSGLIPGVVRESGNHAQIPCVPDISIQGDPRADLVSGAIPHGEILKWVVRLSGPI
jgi:hypothetical protein